MLSLPLYKRSYSLTIDLIPANFWLDLMVSVIWTERSWPPHHIAWHTSRAEYISRVLVFNIRGTWLVAELWLVSASMVTVWFYARCKPLPSFPFPSLMLCFSNRNYLQTGKSATRARMARIITLILWQRRVGGIRLPWAIKSVSEPVTCSSSTRTRVVPVPGKK